MKKYDDSLDPDAQKILDNWRLVRRSGIAVCLVSHFLEWVPDSIYQVGVGLNCEEVEVFKIHWPNAKLFGFEPNSDTVRKLEKTYPGHLLEIAVTDEVGMAKLHVKHRHRDGASLFAYDDGISASTQNCYTAPLDLLVVDGPSTNKTLLWLDCEGSEMAALNGAKKFLEKVEVINIEMTAKPLSPEWPSQVELHKRLLELGFLRIWTHTQRSAQGQTDCIYVRNHVFRPEFCCCPCSTIEYEKRCKEGQCDKPSPT